MPTYVEAETLDGEIFRWVVDDTVIDKLEELLGAPDTMKL